MGLSATVAVVAAATVGVFVAAEPRYVALCSTDGSECATASLTSDGQPDTAPQLAVVSLDDMDEVSLVNRNASGSTEVSVVGYFKGGKARGELGRYQRADAATGATFKLGKNETRHISLPGTPRGWRAALVEIRGHRDDSRPATAKRTTAPAEETSTAPSAAPTTGTPSVAPALPVTDATVEVTSGVTEVDTDEVAEAVRRHHHATASPGTTTDADEVAEEVAEQVTETTKPGSGTRQPSSTPTATPTATPTPTETTQAPAPAPAPTKSTAAPAPAPAPTKTTAPAPAPAPSVPAGNGSTGVPAGTQLKVVQGDQTITTAGTVLDGLDIRGRVIVKAENVTIKNSIIRGTDQGGKYGLVDAMAGKPGLKIYDSEIVATTPNYTVNGIMGSGFELHRVNIHNTVDQVHIAGSNVVVKDSWLHGTVHYENDPYHSDGSHDDNIQIVAGNNILISGNVMEDAQNTAIMVNQDSGATSNVTITGNKMDDGDCIMNVTSEGTVRGLTVTNNIFGLNGSVNRCAVYSPVSPVAMSGNTWTDGTAALLRSK
ncbi:right-handed parallel beta-helix repeat-containing protein [Naasia sp. SYSU D00057]|uniref:right-handed parallel beta-helix repeat-containing protein n=1 Tax=Naasia sp. SYSU D00057 TaxID=2817380 RepID=UPI001B317CBE|nr:right-handed parallel beta-helix repeat-containing protein [Naasia sp. SYSU D00057]